MKPLRYNLVETQKVVNEILKEVVSICNDNDVMYFCQAGTVLGTIRHKGPIPWDYDADIIVPNDQIDRFVEVLNSHLSEKYYVDYYKNNPSSFRQFPRIGLRGYSTTSLHLDVFRLIGLPNDRKEQLKLKSEAKYYENKVARMRLPAWKLFLKGYFELCYRKIKSKGSDINDILEFVKVCDKYPYSKAKYVCNPSGKYGEKNIFEKSVYGEGVFKPYLDFEVRIPTEFDFYLKQYYGDYNKYPNQELIDKEMKKMFIVK